MDSIENLRSSILVFRSFDIRMEIDADVEQIFTYLTTSNGIKAWWADEADVDNRSGGTLHISWHLPEGRLTGHALFRRFKAPDYFEMEFIEWEGPDDMDDLSPYPAPVYHSFEIFENLEGTSSLFVRTSGMYNDKFFNRYFNKTRTGWINSLANLKSVCETNTDLRSQLNYNENWKIE